MDELKNAFFVNRLKTTVSAMELAHGKVDVNCEGCFDSGDKAEGFCRQCAIFICKDCIKKHKRLKTYLTHEVASLEDLNQGQAKPIIVKRDPASVKCSIHNEPLIIYCFDCDMVICRDCTVKDHREHNFEFSNIVAATTKSYLLKKLDPLKSHSSSLSHAVEEVMTTKQELEAHRGTLANTIKIQFSLKCSIHEEPLIIYCFDCDMVICRDCAVRDHRDHNFEFCKKAAATTKSNLLEKLDPLKSYNSSLSHAVEEVMTTKQELEAQLDTVANTIKISFKELHDILDNRERELLGEANRLVQEKIHRFSVQEKTLSLASAVVQSVVDYTEQCVRHCTDNEVMSMHTEIRSRIECEIDECSKSRRNLGPVQVVDTIGVEVRCAEALQQLCQTQANIVELPIDRAKCTVTMEDSTKHEVSKTSTLVTRLSSNKIS